jgi:hypothetical protein
MPSSLTILGDHPFAKTPQGKLKCRIGTIFPRDGVLVMLPGIHATQRQAYLDWLEEHRRASRLEPLSPAEQTAVWNRAVDLVIEEGVLLIRPDPGNMELAFEADELLQESYPKHRIRFLHVLNKQVRDAIKRRGELWRIAPLPRTIDEMKAMIAASRIAIGGKEVYYYNNTTGTRYLTYQDFVWLGTLGEDELRRHLSEIGACCTKTNAQRNLEVRFFQADVSFGQADLAAYDFARLSSAELWETYQRLKGKFREAVAPAFRHDDPSSAEWRNRMVSALLAPRDEEVAEEIMLGLSPEFYMSIHWLPGARIEHGELFLDSVFEAAASGTDEEVKALCDEKVRQFIFNFVREYGDLEYVNVGRVIGSLSHRELSRGRRDVYVAALKLRNSDREIVLIIRMMKWGTREHLDAGRPLDEAMIRSEQYMEYILDRRLGCRQLWMNLPPRITAKRISEWYARGPWRFRIWSPYFERDYVHGIATDKLPNYRFENNEYALAFARLLGRAAAPNMIVGRCDLEGKVLFDDGDEMVIEDARGIPKEIVVADHTGTFNDFLSDLVLWAKDYAKPIRKRLKFVRDPEAFVAAYLDAFVERFLAIQNEYRQRRNAFDTVFKYQPPDSAGNFPYRWQKVLERLDETDPHEIAERIRQEILPTGADRNAEPAVAGAAS